MYCTSWCDGEFCCCASSARSNFGLEGVRQGCHCSPRLIGSMKVSGKGCWLVHQRCSKLGGLDFKLRKIWSLNEVSSGSMYPNSRRRELCRRRRDRPIGRDRRDRSRGHGHACAPRPTHAYVDVECTRVHVHVHTRVAMVMSPVDACAVDGDARTTCTWYIDPDPDVLIPLQLFFFFHCSTTSMGK